MLPQSLWHSVSSRETLIVVALGVHAQLLTSTRCSVRAGMAAVFCLRTSTMLGGRVPDHLLLR
jgi:hypothetical protein